MGSVPSSVSPTSPSGTPFREPQTSMLSTQLRASKRICLCSQTWSKYPVDNQSKWPPGGSLDPRILRGLSNFRQQSGKRKEVPYVRGFTYLSSKPSLCSSCSPTQVLLAMQSKLEEPSATLDPDNEPPLFRPRPCPVHYPSPVSTLHSRAIGDFNLSSLAL